MWIPGYFIMMDWLKPALEHPHSCLFPSPALPALWDGGENEKSIRERAHRLTLGYFNKWKRKRNKWYKDDCYTDWCSASLWATGAFEDSLPPCSPSLPQLSLPRRMWCGREISLWPVQVCSSGYISPIIFPLCEGKVVQIGSCDCVQALLSNSQNFGVVPTQFLPQI